MKEPGPSSPGTKAASDELLRRLIELNPGFLWATDRELRLTVVAGSGLVARGAESPEEFVGKTLHELLEPGDIALEMHGRALTGESVVYTSPRGEAIWQGHVEPLRGPDGEIEGTVGFAMEVTGIVQVEHELDVNRAQLDLSLAQLPAIIWAVDTDMKLTSAAGRPIQDASIPSWIGRPLPEVLGDETHPSIAAHEAALAGGTGEYELTIGERDYRARVDPLRNRDGDVVGAVGLAVDFTVQRREHLATEQLALLVHHSTDAIAGVARDGKVFSWNPAAERLFGWSAEEMIGETTDRIVPPEERAVWTATRARVLAGEAGEELEATRIRKDGTAIRIWLTRSPIFDERGEVAGFCVIARDLGTRERDEEQRRTAQKLEAVARLAGGIAQDFNNLLTAIAGYSELVAGELPEGAGREAVASIQAATERAVTLTQGLLAFGQRRLLNPRSVDLNALVGDAEPLLERLVTRGVTLELTLAPDVQPVLFDPDALRQILFDLVLNASDSMPEGGTIQIETHAAPGAGVLRVEDAGVGMDAETRERAFDPFFSTKDAISGSGLGLASVHGTVLQSGGELRLESSPGGGTWVEVRLPLADAEEPQTAGEALVTGGRVLLVEDDELVRRLVVQTLTNSGYALTTPATPAEALRLARDGAEFDIVLTDLVMPELYGDELLAQLRQLRPGLPAIVMSGYVHDRGNFPEDVEFLPKPFRPSELVAAVARALAR